MTTLKVSFEMLDRLSSKLGTLGNQMTGGDIGMDFYEVGQLAHPTVVRAIHDFTNDWDDRRDVLANKLTNLGELAGKAASQFREADKKLGDQAKNICKEEGK